METYFLGFLENVNITVLRFRFFFFVKSIRPNKFRVIRFSDSTLNKYFRSFIVPFSIFILNIKILYVLAYYLAKILIFISFFLNMIKPDFQVRTLKLAGHVGFDSLPDQLVNKSVQNGFVFNIMCIGK